MNIDWQRVVLNLRSAGLTYAWIAHRLGMENSRPVQRWACGTGAEPRFSVGLELLNLHADLCTERHDIEQLKLKSGDHPYLRAVG